jgi:hypothetical protein
MGFTHLFPDHASSNPSKLAFAATRTENSLRLSTTKKKNSENRKERQNLFGLFRGASCFAGTEKKRLGYKTPCGV